MDFESYLQEAIADAWQHVEVNDGFIEQDAFASLVLDYYADYTYGAADILDEPEDAGRVVKTRAAVIWADDIAPNNPSPGEPVDLDAPLSEEEAAAIDGWLDGFGC